MYLHAFQFFNANIYLECLLRRCAHWMRKFMVEHECTGVPCPFVHKWAARNEKDQKTKERILRRRQWRRWRWRRRQIKLKKSDATGFIWMTIKTCWAFLLLRLCVCATWLGDCAVTGGGCQKAMPIWKWMFYASVRPVFISPFAFRFNDDAHFCASTTANSKNAAHTQTTNPTIPNAQQTNKC